LAIEGPEADFVDDQDRAIEIALGLEPRGRDQSIALEGVHEVVEHEVNGAEAVRHGRGARGERDMAFPDAGRAERLHPTILAHRRHPEARTQMTHHRRVAPR
jgi:hypothetical protein